MKVKPNIKNFIILISYVVTSLIILKDVINLIKGNSYTWLGLITGIIIMFINVYTFQYINDYINKKSVNALPQNRTR